MISGAAPAVGAQRRRQLLVERQVLGAAGRDERTVDDVLRSLALLHSTDPATPYLSFHARSGAMVGDVDDVLYSAPRRALRHTTIRRTVFVIDGDAVPFAHGAYNPSLVDRLRAQLVKWLSASPDVDGPATAFLERTERLVLEHLAAAGAVTGMALAKAVAELQAKVDPMPGAAYSTPIRITSKVLEVLAAEGRIGRGRPTGADFTSSAWTWESADVWWPNGVGALDSATALAGLIGRYLAAFGPATVTDMAWWTGLTKTAIRSALVAIDAVEVALGDSESGWVHRADIDHLAEITGPDEMSVALLPGLDVTTMGWKHRAWYVDDSKHTGLFDRNGNAGPTVWVDGRVVGAWTQRADGQVVTELLEDVGREAARHIDDEADRIERWLGDVRIKWRFPTPIAKRLSGG